MEGMELVSQLQHEAAVPGKCWRLTLLVGAGKSLTAVTLDSKGIISEVVMQ